MIIQLLLASAFLLGGAALAQGRRTGAYQPVPVRVPRTGGAR